MFKKYDAYKDSDNAELPNVPVCWKVDRIKYEIQLLTGYPFNSSKYSEDGIKLVRGINVKESVLDWKDTAYWPAATPDLQRYLLRDGDLLIGMDGSKVGKNFCQVSEQDLPLLLLQRVARLRVKNLLNARYLYWNLASKRFLNWINRSKTDPMIPHMAPKDINDFVIAYPSTEEQSRIALFLDQKTSEIDQAIAIKEQQIALLNERKQIVIQQAVTQGLDPNVPMKDSGVEWIGQIPEHWNIHKLSYVAKLDSGSTPDRSNMRFWTNGTIPWLKTGEINYNLITQAEEFVTPLALSKSALKLAPKGTVLMAMYGQGITRGRVAILDIDATYNQACCAIQCKKGLFNKYLFQFFSFAYSFIRDGGNETSQMNISTGYISNLKVLVPALNEQEQIVSYLDLELQKFSDLKALLKLEIEKLREYKTTLINDAVTGKIKVA